MVWKSCDCDCCRTAAVEIKRLTEEAMRKEAKEARFKVGDVVRITFIAEVCGAWVDRVGDVLYVVHPTVESFPEECLEPWVEDQEQG